MRKRIEKIIAFLLIIFSGLTFVGWWYFGRIKVKPKITKNEAVNENFDDKQIQCINLGGKYLKGYDECEFRNIEAGKSACKEMKGDFRECASACRHSTGSRSNSFCTTECVGVCSWK